MKKNILKLFLALIACVSAVYFMGSCQKKNAADLYFIQKNLVTDNAIVVSAHPLASQVGKEILQKGGNAVDATIAVQFALAVVCPRAGNIGGGGFMVVRTAEGESAALDYREKAPAAAHPDMYLDSLGDVLPDVSRLGHLSVGVPGTVAGMIAAHERYGRIKDFGELITPAINLAAEGFKITKPEADRLNKYAPDFKQFCFVEKEDDDFCSYHPFVKENTWQVGDLLMQADLAETLRRIKENGNAGFYEGQTADYLVKEIQRGKGIITKQDLLNYEAKWRDPIIGEYKNYRMISMPPPSSGGVCMLQILEAIEDYPLSEYGYLDSRAVHLIAEAERRAYADRAKHLGDNDFYPVPLDTLLNPAYIRERMADFLKDKATPSDSILAGNIRLAPESFETTHTSVVDEDGNAVSVTTTLNLNYGSKVLVKGAGFFLNDEMDDFSAKPGVPNFFGLVGAEANKIEANKRMLSSMTPTIFEKDGELFMVIGSPGGSTIITSVLQVFLNVAEFGMTLEEAVAAKRFHHQWLPNAIMIEEGTPIDSLTLQKMGHKIDPRKRLGLVKAIQVLPNGKLSGSGDPRNADDAVSGY